jgi:hypothetical protein
MFSTPCVFKYTMQGEVKTFAPTDRIRNSTCAFLTLFCTGYF